MGNVRLLDVALQEVDAESLYLKVKDYWSGNGWKWESINHLLPSSIILQLAAKPISAATRRTDTLSRKIGLNREYSISSAYWCEVP